MEGGKDGAGEELEVTFGKQGAGAGDALAAVTAATVGGSGTMGGYLGGERRHRASACNEVPTAGHGSKRTKGA